MNAPRQNRLANEASPYLVQHSKNPVDWYPWGKEALDVAARFDKPILLSIGYSACHWCHVMERECFENEEIAALMNREFVCIKVDREERPDLDQVYQLVVQLLRHGGGGWPLTVFLTSDQKPFFGGTYFPPVDSHGLPGFPRVLRGLADSYRNRRSDIHEQSSELVDAMSKLMMPEAHAGEKDGGVSSGTPPLSVAIRKIESRMDPDLGGFRGRPKFPNTMSLSLLLRAATLDGDAAAKRVFYVTLDKMRDGGIYDQLGFGFHRYSTDEKWLVPHFEKMLYDNALLLRLYTDAWKASGDEKYKTTVLEIAAYIEREMTSPDGGFFSAQDADSEGEEGRFFVFSKSEVERALSLDPEALSAALIAFDVTDEGNFEHSHSTVLSRAVPAGAVAEKLGILEGTAVAAIERARVLLFQAREGRVRPFSDEKVLASWNGLLIGALAHAGGAFGDPKLVGMAERAMAAVRSRLIVDGPPMRMNRLYKGDGVRGPGLLDDYAYIADAALDLYGVTGSADYARLARRLCDAILERFQDPKNGGFFFTPDDGESLIVRAKDLHDHAIPNAAAVACRVLSRLGALLGGAYHERARREIEAVAPIAASNPLGMTEALSVVDTHARLPVSVVLVGDRGSPALVGLAAAAQRPYLPHAVVAWFDPADPKSREACTELAAGKQGPTGVAYVCTGFTCSAPVSDPVALLKLLRP